MAYNLTQISTNASQGLLPLFQSINNILLFDMLGVLMLISIGAIFFIGFYAGTSNSKTSMAGAAFICFVLSLFLRAVSLVSDLVIFTVLIGSAIALVFVWRE